MKYLQRMSWIVYLLSCLLCGLMYASSTQDITLQLAQGERIAASDLPGIQELSLPDELTALLSGLTFQESDCAIHDNGTIVIKISGAYAGVSMPVAIAVTPYDATFLDLTVPDGVALTHFFPMLNKLSLFACKETHIIVTTVDHTDTDTHIAMQPGALLVGSLVLSGQLMYVAWMLGQDWLELPFSAQLKKNIQDTVIAVELPGSMQFWGGVNASQARLQIGFHDDAMAPFSFGSITTGLTLDWVGQAPITCAARIDLGSTQATVTGSFDGTIHNIFGIYGVDARNGVLGGIIDYKKLSTTTGRTPLTDFFLQFDLALAAQTVTMTSYVDLELAGSSPQIALEGSFVGDISLHECVDFVGNAVEACPNIPEGIKEYQDAVRDYVPNVVIHKAHVAFSPHDMQFDGRTFTKGLVCDGDAEFFGVGAHLYLDFQERGLKIAGSLDKITFGPVTITGAGRDGVDGTADDGVTIDAELSLERHYCVLNGRVEVDLFGGISDRIKVDLSRAGFSFMTTKKIADLFTCDLAFHGDLDDEPRITALRIKGSMQQTALNKLQELLSVTANQVAKKRLRAAVKANFNWKEMFINAGRALVAMYNNFWAFLASVVGNTFNVTECTFEGEFNELTNASELKHICMKGTLLGKSFELRDVSFDLNSPAASAQTIVELVLRLFEE